MGLYSPPPVTDAEYAPILRQVESPVPDMKVVLRHVEELMPRILRRDLSWFPMVLDEVPAIHRLTTRIGPPGQHLNLMLHRFPKGEPVADGKLYFHPHQWMAGIRNLRGGYDEFTGVGEMPGWDYRPKPSVKTRCEEGSMRVMQDPALWHSIQTYGREAWTLMVTHRPPNWPVPMGLPSAMGKLPKKLMPEQANFMLQKFRDFYPLPLAAPSPQRPGAPAACFPRRDL